MRAQAPQRNQQAEQAEQNQDETKNNEEEEEEYNEETEMRAALQRLGLSALAANEFINNGISSVQTLRLLGKDDLDRLIKQIHRDNAAAGGAGIFIPFLAQTYVHAVHFWANRMYILGQDFDETLIDLQMARAWTTVMREENDASNLTTDVVKTPDPFKKDTKWKTWKESVTTYLHSKIGQAHLPLAYIIRPNDVPTPGLRYATTHDQLVDMAVLAGPEYSRNNGIVFDLIQSLTINGPAWPWIQNFQTTRDGRKAWKALSNY